MVCEKGRKRHCFAQCASSDITVLSRISIWPVNIKCDRAGRCEGMLMQLRLLIAAEIYTIVLTEGALHVLIPLLSCQAPKWKAAVCTERSNTLCLMNVQSPQGLDVPAIIGFSLLATGKIVEK